ncbi:acyl-homoserine-lactone synthase [Sphingopyxis witflariensis]|uniref:Acyl-homoserine-lactone synthase n=1 Tax=Sphingopyxis witflariensis TaxID=173675 RepID=A0A246JGK2_9SPHN|nr:acyl-homoserine-lactone synthase [Sphingopyxis witflariensis]OWQ91651.1 autoinducer synthase [Sphingopyxis witflariensis]
MTSQSTRAQDAPGHAALRAMFAARKQVFIDLLKWDLPALDGRYELDHFDNEDARYLILLDPDGRHRASARLLPTSGAHLLGDLYPWLCSSAPPSGPSVWEISRFCLDPACDSDERRDARNQLVTALAEYALRHGITDYIGVAEQNWFDKISRFGWDCSALGETRREAGCELLALHIRINDDTLAGLERAGIYAPLALHLEEGGTIQ